ncbi:unnamed protein product [Peniophora sp. CBMAI 1063]|nr:unnamed protein product [Peniophora sp. CBMAI 1063]
MAGGQAEDLDRRYDGIETGGSVALSSPIVTSGYPERQEYKDCLDPALDYIPEHLNVDIAIAHDEDLHLLPEPDRDGPVVHINDGFGPLQGPLADPVGHKTSEAAQDPLYEGPFLSVPAPTITEDLSEAQYGDFPPLIHPCDARYATELALTGAMLAQQLSQGMPSREEADISPQHRLHATSAWGFPEDPLNTTTLHPSPSEFTLFLVHVE